MKIRLIGREKLIETIVKVFNLNVKIYQDRKDYRNKRIYLEFNDKLISEKLQEIAKLFIYLSKDEQE